MKIDNFFKFGSKLVLSTFQASPIGLKNDKNEVNDQWNLIKGMYGGINFPVIFKQTDGKKITDLLDTGWPGLFLISDKMKVLLEENDLTGWKTYPIKLYDKKDNETFGYHGFSIIGHCGPIDYNKSEIIEKRLVPTGPLCKYYKGIFIDTNTWNKTDFFSPTNTYHQFITERAANVFKNNKLTNVKIKNVADYKTPLRYIKNF